MSDRAFETELDRLFAEAPVLSDAEAFAAAVVARIERGWMVRRLTIGGLGLAGGLFGAWQVLGSGVGAAVTTRLGALGTQTTAALEMSMSQAPLARSTLGLLADASGANLQYLVMSAAMAVVAVGLFVTRALREI